MRYRLAPFRAQGRGRVAWEVAIFAGAVVSLVVGPLAVAFGALSRFWYVLPAFVLDVLFLADIAFRFNCAYVEQREEVREPGRIARRYLRGLFILDLVAVLAPFVADIILLAGASQGNTVLVLLVLARLIKLPVASKNLFTALPDQAAFGPARLVKMLFWLAVASHLISCGFLYIGAIVPGDRPALAWLQALYWTVTTIATIGYGDIVPDRTSALQLGYTIMAELVGVGMFGFIIGNIASLIANLDSAKAQHRGKMEVVGTFIRERSLPRDLARRMTAYYDYLWETRRGGGGEELLEELPAALRTEVALYLNRELIEQVPLFEGASGHFVEDLVLRLKPRIALPGEYVIRKGENGCEMYFISRGSVEVVTADGKTVLAQLGAGQFFGEMALVLEAPRSASIRAVGYCDLYTLSKRDFEEVLALYPAFARSIRTQAEERQQRNQPGRDG